MGVGTLGRWPQMKIMSRERPKSHVGTPENAALCRGPGSVWRHLCPAWLPLRDGPGTGELKNRVGGEVVRMHPGGPGEGVSACPCWSSPRTSPSALPVLPRIPGPHLQPPPSLEGLGKVLSSWGALEGARGLLLSPHSQHCRQDTDRVKRCLGNPSIHSFGHW